MKNSKIFFHYPDTISKLPHFHSAVSSGIFIKIADAPLGRDKYHKILTTVSDPFRNSRSVNVQPLNSMNHIVFFFLQFTRIVFVFTLVKFPIVHMLHVKIAHFFLIYILLLIN